MKASLLRELVLYRYRYLLGYALFVLFLFAMFSTDIGSLPYGLSNGEMKSAVASNSLNLFGLRPGDIVELPYHLLQKASIKLFGLSALTVRLPSIILSVLASIVLAVTLNHWFRKGVAVLALLIAATSVPFISLGRLGTPAVLSLLLLLIILLAAITLTVRNLHAFWWKCVVVISGLLLLYMPLGIYMVIAIGIAGVFHPHVRYQIKHTRWWQAAVLGLVTIVLLAPLVMAISSDRQSLELLLGIQSLHSKLTVGSLTASTWALLKSLLLFHKTIVGEIITPLLGLPFALLVLFGLTRTIIDHHAARSYLLHIWLLIDIPLLLLNPDQIVILFVPCIMLMAIGLQTFIGEWYRLFPRNPYARIGAMVPLGLIVIGIVTISASRYFYSYYYTDTRNVFKPGLASVLKTLQPHVMTRLVVPADQVAFYDILRADYPLLSVVGPSQAPGSASETIILADAGYTPSAAPTHIVTAPYVNNPVVLRAYGE